MDNDIRSLLMTRPACDQLYAQVLSSGMVPLAMDGLSKVDEGIISFEELMRVLT